jgi:hypothetical protein
MPGANAPVQLARIHTGEEGSFAALVRFPPGWSRPASGHYAAAEEFLVLEGDLGFNGVVWRAGSYAFIAAGRVRTGSRSAQGCLALAWFAGAPRWIAGEPAEPAGDADPSFADWRDAPLARRLAALLDAVGFEIGRD